GVPSWKSTTGDAPTACSGSGDGWACSRFSACAPCLRAAARQRDAAPRPPSLGGILGDAQGLAPLGPPQADVVLPPPEPLRSPRPGGVSHGVPAPARRRFRLPQPPPVGALGAPSTTHLQRIRAPAFPLALLRVPARQPPMMHWRQLRRFFCRALL